MRVLVALGGNAMTSPEGSATLRAQRTAIAGAMECVADLVAAGHEVVITHGNGPRSATCWSRTSSPRTSSPGPAGLERRPDPGHHRLHRHEHPRAGPHPPRLPAPDRSRRDSHPGQRRRPGFTRPTKPVGRFLPYEDARPLIDHGQIWEDRGEKGWRRVVASPEPLEVIDTTRSGLSSPPAMS